MRGSIYIALLCVTIFGCKIKKNELYLDLIRIPEGGPNIRMIVKIEGSEVLLIKSILTLKNNNFISSTRCYSFNLTDTQRVILKSALRAPHSLDTHHLNDINHRIRIESGNYYWENFTSDNGSNIELLDFLENHIINRPDSARIELQSVYAKIDSAFVPYQQNLDVDTMHISSMINDFLVLFDNKVPIISNKSLGNNLIEPYKLIGSSSGKSFELYFHVDQSNSTIQLYDTEKDTTYYIQALSK
jgi:hypothetical protein